MNELALKCPSCGHAFPLTDASAAQLRGEVHAALAARHQFEVRKLPERAVQAEAREPESSRRSFELEQSQAAAVGRARMEAETRLRAAAQRRPAQKQQSLQADAEQRSGERDAQGAETREQLEAAQAAEPALRCQRETASARERQPISKSRATRPPA